MEIKTIVVLTCAGVCANLPEAVWLALWMLLAVQIEFKTMGFKTVYLCCALPRHVHFQMRRCSVDLHSWRLLCCTPACMLRGFAVLRPKRLTWRRFSGCPYRQNRKWQQPLTSCVLAWPKYSSSADQMHNTVCETPHCNFCCVRYPG